MRKDNPEVDEKFLDVDLPESTKTVPVGAVLHQHAAPLFNRVMRPMPAGVGMAGMPAMLGMPAQLQLGRAGAALQRAGMALQGVIPHLHAAPQVPQAAIPQPQLNFPIHINAALDPANAIGHYNPAQYHNIPTAYAHQVQFRQHLIAAQHLAAAQHPHFARQPTAMQPAMPNYAFNFAPPLCAPAPMPVLAPRTRAAAPVPRPVRRVPRR